MQLRYETGLTSDDYVSRQAWCEATLERCPLHPRGGCGFARHGTYERMDPLGARVARWYCPLGSCTFSLLADCLAVRLPGALVELEAVVAVAEQATSVAAAANTVRSDDIDLVSAMRWGLRRRNARRKQSRSLLFQPIHEEEGRMPTATVDSLQYYFREVGQGPLVILGHSDAGSSGQWHGLMKELGGEFRLRAFDTAGQGRSHPWPEERPYSVGAESKIVDALAATELGRIHLVGHSAGGMFVLDAALRLGTRLASLTLVEPVMFSLLRYSVKEQAWAEVQQVAGTFQELVRAGHPEEAMAGFVDYWTTQGAWAAIPEDRRTSMLVTAPKISLQWDASFRDDYTLAEISRLSCPTLLIRGSETTLAARSVVDVLYGALPDRRLVEIEGAGHMSTVSHAEVVNAHIADHLRRHADS